MQTGIRQSSHLQPSTEVKISFKLLIFSFTLLEPICALHKPQSAEPTKPYSQRGNFFSPSHTDFLNVESDQCVW